MKRTVCLAAILMIAAPLTAQAEEMRAVAKRLAVMIVGADACEVTLDTDAMIAHLSETIDAGDLDFNSRLEYEMSLAQNRAETLEGAQKALHCAQTRRNAEHYGWMKTE